MTNNMDTPKERIQSLIEFTKEAANLKNTPVRDINKSSHNVLTLTEDKLLDLPGIQFNLLDEEEQEIWLKIDRLQKTKAPLPNKEEALLSLWLDLKLDETTQAPSLKTAISRQALLDIGVQLEAPDSDENSSDLFINQVLKIEPKKTQASEIKLEQFADKAILKQKLKTYINQQWKPWAENEKKVQKTIGHYRKFFELYQEMQGYGSGSIELIWGIGMLSWKLPEGDQIQYPLISKAVEISLDDVTMSIEIRPCTTEPRLEHDIFSGLNNLGVADLIKTANTYFKTTDLPFSPFDSDSYEDLLKKACSKLDASGVYWPSKVGYADRTIPKPCAELAITNTWVIIGQPRSNNILLRDLGALLEGLIDLDEDDLPNAIKALVTDPSSETETQPLPNYRGISPVEKDSSSHSDKVSELYFPKAYNDEQVRIIRMLDVYDGVVVQGPPGTGKTHTIANVICHYLANGKKVLVTSMKDPALKVLQEKLPESIRALAISMLTSQTDGMKQFEAAINTIAAELTRIDRNVYTRNIQDLEADINGTHAKLALIDNQIAAWAKQNLEPLSLDGEAISPWDAAKAVIAEQDSLAWFPDQLTIEPCYTPQFSNEDIIQLRQIRLKLQSDLVYLGAKLIHLTDLPSPQDMAQVHEDLSSLSDLKEQQDNMPNLFDQTDAAIAQAEVTIENATTLRKLIKTVDDVHETWTRDLQQYLRKAASQEVLETFNKLRYEIEAIEKKRQAMFIARPITVDDQVAFDPELIEAIQNLAAGKKPFGLIGGLFGKAVQKQTLDAINILSSKPQSNEDWAYVSQYIALQKHCKDLILRWNAVANEISLPQVEDKFANFQKINEIIKIYEIILQRIYLEKQLNQQTQKLLPTWQAPTASEWTPEQLNQLEKMLAYHVTCHRLAKANLIKNTLLEQAVTCTGQISNDIRAFLQDSLGKTTLSCEEALAKWTELSQELARIHAHQSDLNQLVQITQKIEESGAPNWAHALRTTPYTEANDPWLPDHWQACWRLSRLRHYVESTDARAALKQLSNERLAQEKHLSSLYQKAIEKRTWLQIANNASQKVRASLEAYKTSIKKIGKGTGKRAHRYRSEARDAAMSANDAIPCWIMPHYRVSESLPASFGCFDLVIIDEASQSDFTALPAILRAKKVLIVGDDKQVSPDGIGLEEDRIKDLMGRFLMSQVGIYRQQMSPERSIYDLFKVVFAQSSVMLSEHFRCVAPIIEYSKREFYNHGLKPLRVPTASERMDPPLVDIYVQDGNRKASGKCNYPEASVIVKEIRNIVADPAHQHRSIGVVSLLGAEQAKYIQETLYEELGEALMLKHQIQCGDARTFQGEERDIIFLSMVASPGNAHAITSGGFEQRFNVAASRAKNRMYLVHSILIDQLSQSDILRRHLLQHFQTPFAQTPEEQADLRKLCESGFEIEMYDILIGHGYRVTPQVAVGNYRIDLVVEGDADSRMAIECDGDRYHGPDRWDADMRRQRILERVGWKFWRCFASNFTAHKAEVIADLIETLHQNGIEPSCGDLNRLSLNVEHRTVVSDFGQDITMPEEQSSTTEAEIFDLTSTPSQKTELSAVMTCVK